MEAWLRAGSGSRRRCGRAQIEIWRGYGITRHRRWGSGRGRGRSSCALGGWQHGEAVEAHSVRLPGLEREREARAEQAIDQLARPLHQHLHGPCPEQLARRHVAVRAHNKLRERARCGHRLDEISA
jgi:hypothetical protein